MRRISLALALIGAVAAAGCGGTTSPTGTSDNRGIPGKTFTVEVRGETPVYNPDPLVATTVFIPGGGVVTSADNVIKCGTVNGVPFFACKADYPWGEPASSSTATLTATPDLDPDGNPSTNNPNLYYAFAGDCSGGGGVGKTTTCTVQGNTDRAVLVRFSDDQAGLGSHPTFSDPNVHGAQFEAGTRWWACKDCHGQNLEGRGLAFGCGACHSAAAVQALNAYYDAGNVAPPANTESCNTCHTGAFLNGVHVPTGVVTFAATDPVINGSTATWSVTVMVDGTPSNALTFNAGGYLYFQDATLATTISGGTTGAWAGQVLPVLNPFTRTTLSAITSAATGTGLFVAAPVNGVYAVTARTGLASIPNPATFVTRIQSTSTSTATTLYATAVNHRSGTPVRDLVGDAACVACHATQVWKDRGSDGQFHHGANPFGVSACVVCHTRSTSISRGMGGDRLIAYVHGIHNSDNMPARTVSGTYDSDPSLSSTNYKVFTYAKPAGVYARNEALGSSGGQITLDPSGNTTLSSIYSVGFPSYTNNCSVCHDTPARQAATAARPITFALCMSCHDGWEGFTNLPASPVHTAFNSNTSCASCHAAMGDDPFTFHNGLFTGRAGLIWAGQDQSVVQGARIAMAITGVARPDPSYANSLTVTWSATLDGSAVDPCNQDTTTGNPVFFGITPPTGVTTLPSGAVASNMQFLRSYGVGDDWVGGPGATNSPGQPGGTITPAAPPASGKWVSGNTTCALNVATTVFAKDTLTATPAITRGIIALQGKPQIVYNGTATYPLQQVIAVRSTTPTYTFDVSAYGALPARRAIVSNDKCLSCHAGSLYQHGGNRIDNVALCSMCHNPASNEKNNRVATFGINQSQAYDGKVGETIDLRTLVHSIHSAGETGRNYIVYRTRGIYAFGNDASIAAIPNWKVTPKVTCSGVVENVASPVDQWGVYGSVTQGTVQVPVNFVGPGGAIDPFSSMDPTHVCSTMSVTAVKALGYPQMSYQPFTETVVSYPRHLNDCSACHVNGSENALPNQKNAVAVTVDPGTLYAPFPLTNQNDDVLIGSTAQSCFTCHQSSDNTRQQQLRNHGSNYGWTPQVFPSGRQSVINAAP
jgi:OmcA/MtrC family decaheme c-type cytochrome